jgi:N-acetylmuramoyl-L-alanine amidase
MRLLYLSLSLAILTGCGPLRFVDRPAAVQSSRVDHLVIHFTGERFSESMRVLSERTSVPVSAHYLVPAPDDPTFRRKNLRVHRLVEEERRAWHAGVSYWDEATELNARSIGVEIVNESRCFNIDPDLEPNTPENQRCVFHDYDLQQIEIVIALARDILDRHPDIDPVDVVGHSDIAPDRRLDPGPTFPWRSLYEHGIGAWYDEPTVTKYMARFSTQPPQTALLQRALTAYGYRIEETGETDPQPRFELRAFQTHFRPSNRSGQPDAETAAILLALIEKYRPRALGSLLAE